MHSSLYEKVSMKGRRKLGKEDQQEDYQRAKGKRINIRNETPQIKIISVRIPR